MIYNTKYGLSVITAYFVISWVVLASSPVVLWDTAMVQAANKTFFFALTMIAFWYIAAKINAYYLSRKGK